MDVGIHVISQGKRFRELVEITKFGNQKHSRTFHQVLSKNGSWVNRRPSRKIDKKEK